METKHLLAGFGLQKHMCEIQLEAIKIATPSLVRQAHAEGMSVQEIANYLGYSRQRIYQIREVDK